MTDRTPSPSPLWIHAVLRMRVQIAVFALAGLLMPAMLAAQTTGGQPVTSQPPTDGSASAAQPADASALTLEQLLDVEVESVFGASKSLQKITEAPAAVTVVTASEIERFGWHTLADVLRNVRGFYVTNDRSYSYIGARGFLRPGDYNTRVLVLLDGRRLNDNVFDQAPLDEDFQIDLSEVERIEVIRGPSSSLYGSNAFFGVINVVSRAATKGRSVEVTRGLGNLGYSDLRVHARHSFKNGAAVSFSGTGFNEQGYQRLYYPEYDSPETNNGIAVDRDYLKRRSGVVRVDYGNLVISGGYNSRLRGLPTAAYVAVFGRDESVRDEHTLFDASWSHAVGSWAGTFRGSYDLYDFTGSYPYDWETSDGIKPVDYIDRASGHWWSAEAQFSRRFGTRHQITTGVEYRLNTKQTQFSYLKAPYELLWHDNRQSNTAGAFVQDQFRVTDRLLLNVGLRQDHYSAFKDPLKPRFAAIYNPRPNTTVKMMYGSAFRAPNVFESHYLIPGLWRERADLHPEQIQTVEGVVEHYAGKRLRFSAGAFRDTVEQLIDFTSDPVTDLLYFANSSAARANGIEGEAEAKWPSGLQARVSYTYAHTEDTQDVPLSNSPRHVTQALLSVPLPANIAASFDMQVLSSRLTRDGNVVDGYVLPNLTITAPFAGRRGHVSFDIRNLTNERHSDPAGDDYAQQAVQQNGRTARVFVTFGF
ncbi:MAG: TonB-dependent receptor [Vicinamibacterales bacterium]